MTHILIATTPAAGHVTPFVPLARALVARGHDVRWYTGTNYRPLAEASGTRFVGYERARDLDDARLDLEFPERARLRGLAQLKYDLKHVFIDAAPDQLLDTRAILHSSPARFGLVLSPSDPKCGVTRSRTVLSTIRRVWRLMPLQLARSDSCCSNE